MKLFECQNCELLLYFENTQCERCGHALGYLPEHQTLSALFAEDGTTWRPLAAPDTPHRFCANAAHDACNWLVPADGPDLYCRACRLNRTIPDLDVPENLRLWRRIEAAKRRLVYGLLRLDLPVRSKNDDPQCGLAFDFLSDSGTEFQDGSGVITGHESGLITLDIAEADPAVRERHRQDMVESYRTLLGHFRHEIGHYYWERLVQNGAWHRPFRDLFGDETRDYGETLAAHYANGPQSNWWDSYISAYAGSHPWEDWAESWAHYLHIVDTLETAAAFGLGIQPDVDRNHALFLERNIDFDAYDSGDFDTLIAAWVPLTAAVNSLNQSMGQPELYPFVLAPPVLEKLRFIHRLIHDGKPTTMLG